MCENVRERVREGRRRSEKISTLGESRASALITSRRLTAKPPKHSGDRWSIDVEGATESCYRHAAIN